MPNTRERLVLENFAGIRHLDMEVRPLTVLIGPQSVGKSVAAKLLYFFRAIPGELWIAASAKKSGRPDKHLRERFQQLLPSPTHVRGASTITYSIGETELKLKFSGDEGDKWAIHLPGELQEAFEAARNELAKISEKASESEDEPEGEDREPEMELKARHKYWDAVTRLFPGSNRRPRFVPAGRSFYAQIERDFASYFESATLDPFVSEFAKILARHKQRRVPRTELPQSTAARLLVEQLLSGRYVREGTEDTIHLQDGRKLPSKIWSSGQQEAHPLAFLLQRSCEGHFRPASIFIEEPEAHLFPTSQRTITELIALTFNAHRTAMRVFLTTHSPYILTTINNLLLAGQLYEKRRVPLKGIAARKLVPPDRALRRDSVGVFYMDQGGCRSLLDDDTGLIGATAIDEVSGNLTEQFDAMLELERA